MLRGGRARRLIIAALFFVVISGLLALVVGQHHPGAPSSAAEQVAAQLPQAPTAPTKPGATPTTTTVPGIANFPATEPPAPEGGFTAAVAAAPEPSSAAQPATSGVLYRYPQTTTAPFTMFGVTWSGARDVTVRYQLLQNGVWSAWATFDSLYESTASGPIGTDPLYVGASTGLAVEILGPASSTITSPKITFLDTTKLGGNPAAALPSAPATPQPHADAAGTSTGSFSWAPRPGIKSRAEWGANESYWAWGATNAQAECVYNFDRNDGVIVHHTAGSNDYQPADVPGILNGIFYYHSVTKGWCDIGYNFLVDKWGNAYEGRRGSLENFPLGAHAKGGNWNTTGISFMGNTDQTTVSDAAITTIGQIAAWKLTWSGVAIDSTVTYAADWGQVQLPVIAGHYQVGYTDCPGTDLKSKLDAVRQKAREYVQHPSVSLAAPDQLILHTATDMRGVAPAFMAGREITVIQKDPTGRDWPTQVLVQADGSFLYTAWSGFDSGTGSLRIRMTAPWKLDAVETVPTPISYAPNSYSATISSSSMLLNFNENTVFSGMLSPARGGIPVTVYGFDPDSHSTQLLGTTTTQASGSWSLPYRWVYGPATSMTVWAVATPGARTPGADVTLKLKTAITLPITSYTDRTSPVTLTGTSTQAPGTPVQIKVIDGTGTASALWGSAVVSSTGTFTITSTWNDPATAPGASTDVVLQAFINGVPVSNRTSYTRQTTPLPLTGQG